MGDNDLQRTEANEPLLNAGETYHDRSGKERHSASNEFVEDERPALARQQRPLASMAVMLVGSVVFSVFVGLTALWLGYHIGTQAASRHDSIHSPFSSSLSSYTDSATPHNEIVFTNGTIYDRPVNLKIVGIIFCTSIGISWQGFY